MKTILYTKRTSRKLSVLAFAIVLLSCLDTVSDAQPVCPTVQTPQSGCFTVVSLCNNPTAPCAGACTVDGSDCSNCWNFKIFGCDGTSHPDDFVITADDGTFQANPACFSVCSPNGDFGVNDSRTNCDQQNKWIDYQRSSPLTTTNGGAVTICAAPGTEIHISLVHHSGTTPCQQPCQVTDIQF